MRASARRTLPGVLRTFLAAALVVPLSGCSLVSYVVGKEKRDVYKFEQPFTVVGPGRFAVPPRRSGPPMVNGNSAEILKNGDEIFPAMTKAIREAKQTVNLETYIFQPDKAGGSSPTR